MRYFLSTIENWVNKSHAKTMMRHIAIKVNPFFRKSSH